MYSWQQCKRAKKRKKLVELIAWLVYNSTCTELRLRSYYSTEMNICTYKPKYTRAYNCIFTLLELPSCPMQCFVCVLPPSCLISTAIIYWSPKRSETQIRSTVRTYVRSWWPCLFRLNDFELVVALCCLPRCLLSNKIASGNNLSRTTQSSNAVAIAVVDYNVRRSKSPQLPLERLAS